MLDPPWFDGVFPSGLYILWSLCGHLQTSALHNHHESQDLLPACSRLLLAGFLVTMGLQLDFCDSNVIDHFTCDAAPLLQISCTDTSTLERMSFVLAVLTLMSTLTLVILSHSYILRTILRIPSAQQRKKAFSTCSSHMIVISLSLTEAPSSCLWKHQPRKVLLWQSG